MRLTIDLPEDTIKLMIAKMKRNGSLSKSENVESPWVALRRAVRQAYRDAADAAPIIGADLATALKLALIVRELDLALATARHEVDINWIRHLIHDPGVVTWVHELKPPGKEKQS